MLQLYHTIVGFLKEIIWYTVYRSTVSTHLHFYRCRPWQQHAAADTSLATVWQSKHESQQLTSSDGNAISSSNRNSIKTETRGSSMVGGNHSKASTATRYSQPTISRRRKIKGKTRLWQQHTVLDTSLAIVQQSSHERQQSAGLQQCNIKQQQKQEQDRDKGQQHGESQLQ